MDTAEGSEHSPDLLYYEYQKSDALNLLGYNLYQKNTHVMDFLT